MFRPFIQAALEDSLMEADVAQLATEWPLCFLFGLEPGATVVVAGAYQGKVMQLLGLLYPGVKVYGFEPQTWAADRARERLLAERRPLSEYRVFDFGLGASSDDQVLPMGEYETDAASFVNLGARKAGEGRLFPFPKVMDQLGIDRIDLFVMNMEGYEFALLPALRDWGWLSKVERIAVQWHLFPDLHLGEEDMTDEISLLTHDGYRLTLDQRPAWTYHER